MDSSGFGSESEPALTKSGLERELINIIDEHGPITVKIIGSGMFQAYLGIFKKVRKSKIQQVTSTVFTYEKDIEGEKYLVVRLYETDIVSLSNNHVILNSGGYQTRTTSKWINKYLPDGYFLYSEKWVWYIDTPSNKKIPFIDGIKLSIN